MTFRDFTAANDPVLANGVVRIGINNYLPAFSGLPGLDAAVDVIAAHQPTTYAAALGLPDWVSAADQQAATAAISVKFTTGNSTFADLRAGREAGPYDRRQRGRGMAAGTGRE